MINPFKQKPQVDLLLNGFQVVIAVFVLNCMRELSQCHSCGGMFPDEFMADWTICFSCQKRHAEEYYREEVYIDPLGNIWTRAELEEAGGVDEVSRMAREVDAREKYLN